MEGKIIDGVLEIDGYLDISQESEEQVADAIYNRLVALGNSLLPSQLPHAPPSRPTPKRGVSE